MKRIGINCILYKVKADLHIHTNYSYDCMSNLEAIVKRCQLAGINCIAVADHGTAEGALKMQSLASFPVIVAEEIMTQYGEVMGMFLKKSIPTRIPLAEAISRIHEQDGLVCIPHPFDKPNRSGLTGRVMEQIIDDIDIIEVLNSRSPLPWFSAQALAFAQDHHKAQSAGSDAHTVREVGLTYVEMPEFNGKTDFLEALHKGVIHGRMTNPFRLLLGGGVARIRKLF